MLDLSYSESILVLLVYSVSCIVCIGLGYAWGFLTKLKEESSKC